MIHYFCLESWYHMSNFTIKRSFWLGPSQEVLKEYKKIDKYMELLEKSGVGKILEYVKLKDKKCKGRIGYNPYNLFATIVYCFSFFKATLRDIEEKCKFDIRVIYLMEGSIPDYSTICNFINTYILPYQYEIFSIINKQIIKELHLDISNNYLDGTKIEANANKYKFVWKPRKHHQTLDLKIKSLILDMGLKYSCKDEEFIQAYEFNEILKSYSKANNIDMNTIPNGRGKR